MHVYDSQAGSQDNASLAYSYFCLFFFFFYLQLGAMHVKWIHTESQADAPISAF